MVVDDDSMLGRERLDALFRVATCRCLRQICFRI
jgi:hypothetical protein